MGVLKRDLTTNELLILHSELKQHEKSLAIAYLMLLGGHLGIHRFYLRKIGSAVAQLSLTVTLIVLYIAFCTIVDMGADTLEVVLIILMVMCLAALIVWIIVDLFLIPRMVRSYNMLVEQDVMNQIIHFRSSPHAAEPPRF